MCLLTYYPEGIQPDTEALWNGTLMNNDGHGFAIVTRDRKIIVRKGMNALQMIDKFADLRQRFPDGPALFHSRFGTGGRIDKANCHPYYYEGRDRRTVIAHNGVLPREVWPGKKDPRSDTRIATEEFIPVYFEIHRSKGRKALKRWVTPANKLVILTVDPRYARTAYLINESRGIWDDGIWYSNDAYRPLLTKMDDRWFREVTEETVCPTCHMVGELDWVSGVCRYCDHCIDCDQISGACLCWVPANGK